MWLSFSSLSGAHRNCWKVVLKFVAISMLVGMHLVFDDDDKIFFSTPQSHNLATDLDAGAIPECEEEKYQILMGIIS